MDNNVIKLDFEGNKIRSLQKEDGSIWFIASDVCKVLEIKNTSDALRRLHKNEQGIGKTYTYKNQGLLEISESGLYKLILRSNSKQAIRFQDWVTQEVLPSIRKDGGYVNTYDVRDPYSIIENMYVQVQRMNTQLTNANKQIETMKPVVQLVDNFFKRDVSDISFNTMAKLSKFINPITGKQIGGRMLKDICVENKICSSKNRIPNQDYINKGYFKVIYTQKWFEGCLHKLATSLITQKGQKWLYNKVSNILEQAA